MHFLGKFYYSRKKISFYGLYDQGENLVYPIESIFFPNKTGAPVNGNHVEPILCLQPSKIICIGKNYKSHVREFNSEIPKEPIIFLKAPNSIIGPNERIIIPAISELVDYEGEIAIVIKKEAENVPEDKALDYVLGYTCANDVTARDLQKKDGQWARAKSFKTFCPVGPWILPVSEFPKYQDLSLKTYVNNKPGQFAKATSMIFPIPYLVSFVSCAMTLYPGDIILSGTPAGVGQLKRNYKVSVEIEQIGILTNTVTSNQVSKNKDRENKLIPQEETSIVV